MKKLLSISCIVLICATIIVVPVIMFLLPKSITIFYNGNPMSGVERRVHLAQEYFALSVKAKGSVGGVTFSSSDPKIADFKSGSSTAELKSTGTVTITARSKVNKRKKDSFTLTVTELMKDAYVDYFPIGAAVAGTGGSWGFNSDGTTRRDMRETDKMMQPHFNMAMLARGASITESQPRGCWVWVPASSCTNPYHGGVHDDRFTHSVEWALDHGMSTYGHDLFHYTPRADLSLDPGTSGWILRDRHGSTELASPAVIFERIDNFVQTMIRRYAQYEYKGKVYNSVLSWNVVNEAIDNSVTAMRVEAAENGDVGEVFWNRYSDETNVTLHEILVDNGLNPGLWVYQAYKSARLAVYESGQDIKLYYNDYSMTRLNKLRATVLMINWMEETWQNDPDYIPGTRLVDGMGIQAYMRMGNYFLNGHQASGVTGSGPGEWLNQATLDGYERAIKTFTEMGIDVRLSELGVGMADVEYNGRQNLEIYHEGENRSDYRPIPKELEIKQAAMYGKIMELARKYAESSKPWGDNRNGYGYMNAVCFWATTEENWRSATTASGWSGGNHWNAPFDIYGNPKLAVDAIVRINRPAVDAPLWFSTVSNTSSSALPILGRMLVNGNNDETLVRWIEDRYITTEINPSNDALRPPRTAVGKTANCYIQRLLNTSPDTASVKITVKNTTDRPMPIAYSSGYSTDSPPLTAEALTQATTVLAFGSISEIVTIPSGESYDIVINQITDNGKRLYSIRLYLDYGLGNLTGSASVFKPVYY